MDTRITPDELWELFPDGIPTEAMAPLWHGDPNKTLGELREELKAIAANPMIPPLVRVILEHGFDPASAKIHAEWVLPHLKAGQIVTATKVFARNSFVRLDDPFEPDQFFRQEHVRIVERLLQEYRRHGH